jgi:hypothetical protein
VPAPTSGGTQIVTLTHLGDSAVIARETGEESCTSLLEADQTQALTTQLTTLAQEHYPSPYPDTCLDAIDKFEEGYAGLQTCSQASDCAYVGQDLSVIPYDSSQVVFEEDYTKLEPIVVANASKLTAAKAQLTQGRQDLQTSCGDGFWRSPVPATFRQFYSNAGNPLCDEGKCKVNPSVFTLRIH